MSKKDLIFDTLRRELPDIPFGYRYSDNTVIPRMSFALISNGTERLSNKRHSQRVIYQIDYLSAAPLNVETDVNLNKVIEALEHEGLVLTDWSEIETIEPDESRALFAYWIEVR